MNDGICNNGLCDCPDRFTGPNCQEQATPDKIKLLSVIVSRFPASNHDNTKWDITDDPDIFFRLYDHEGPLAQPLMPIENADPQQDHKFSINTVDLFNVTDVFTLKLLDYEGAGIQSEDMGEIQFQVYQDLNGFPQHLVVDDGGPISFTLELQYLYFDAVTGEYKS